MIVVLNPIGNGGESLGPPRARAPRGARVDTNDRSAGIDSGSGQLAFHRLPRRFRQKDFDRRPARVPAPKQRLHDFQIRLDFVNRRPRAPRPAEATRAPVAESYAPAIQAATRSGEKRKEKRPPIASELDDRR